MHQPPENKENPASHHEKCVRILTQKDGQTTGIPVSPNSASMEVGNNKIKGNTIISFAQYVFAFYMHLHIKMCASKNTNSISWLKACFRNYIYELPCLKKRHD